MDFGSLGEAAPSQIVEKYEPDKCFVVGANLQPICVPYDLVLGRGCAEVLANQFHWNHGCSKSLQEKKIMKQGVRNLRALVAVLALFSLLMIVPSILFAQTTTTGAITGMVTDTTGAVVKGATLTLTHAATGSVQTANSDAGGRFVFPVVNPGDYKLKAEAKGFRTNVTNDLVVEVDKSVNAEVKLEVGASSEVVEVTASSMTEVQTQDSSVGEVLSGTELNRLPVNGRSAAQLIFLQPGVEPDMGHQNGMASDDAGGQIGGARSDQVTFGIDGGDATSDLEGSNNYNGPDKESKALSAVVPIPQDAVEEFRVATNNANATFGEASGQISVLTNSGTNSIHGKAYEYHQDNGLNANGFDNNFSGITKPVSVDNRFGAGLGGAIIKDKLFYYGFYEGRIFHESAGFNDIVPSDQLRSGIIELGGVTYNLNTANGPLTTACAGPCDPRNLGMSPAVAAQFALLPHGNDLSEGDGINTVGFDGTFATPITTNVGKLKLNYNINTKWSAFTTWQYSSTARTGTEQISIAVPGTPTSVSGDPYFANFLTFQLQGQISPTFLSVTHGSFLKNWWGWSRATPVSLVGSLSDAALQIGGEDPGSAASYSASGELFANPININTQQARPRVWDGHDWYIAQNFTKIRGSHQFQFGGEGRVWHDYHFRTDDVLGGLSTAPEYNIGSSTLAENSYAGIGSYVPTGLAPNQVNFWAGYYTSLLGIVDHSSQVETRNGDFVANPLGTATIAHTTLPLFNGYFNDVWKARRNLTITLGLDWGVTLAPHEQNGLQSVAVYADSNAPINMQQFLKSRAAILESGGSYNPTIGFSPVNHLSDPFNGKMRPAQWKNIGPRFAVAWEARPGLVIRGGYSLVWDRSSAVTSVLGGLLAGGLADVDRCGGPVFNGSGTAACSQNATTPNTAYRIGPQSGGWDGASVPVPPGTNLPIPSVPNVSNQLFASFGSDAYITPGYAHVVDFTLQKALRDKYFLEVGYIGRFSRNITNDQQLNAPDYLQKDPASGQTYAQADDAVQAAVLAGATPSPQPFFENLGNAATCNTYNALVFGAPALATGACTSAATNTMAFVGGPGDLGFDDFYMNGAIGQSVFNTPTSNNQVFENAQTTDGAYSNYNAGIVTLRKAMSHGLQFQANYTWSHAIGNQSGNQQYIYSSNSPYHLNLDKASEGFDHRQTMTANWYYELPFGHGKAFSTGNGGLDRAIGGWNISGIFNFWTGSPDCVTNLDGDYGSFFEAQCSIATAGFPSYSRHNGVTSTVAGQPLSGSINAFADPGAVYASLEYPQLSVNEHISHDQLHGWPFWNVDFSLGKKTQITERVGLVVTADAFNIFNHTVLNQPLSMDLNNPGAFGVLNQQFAAGISPTGARTMQLGARVEF
jgi:hypothetical protein